MWQSSTLLANKIGLIHCQFPEWSEKFLAWKWIKTNFYHMEFWIGNTEVDQSDFLNQSRIRLSHDFFSQHAKVDQKYDPYRVKLKIYCQKLIIFMQNSDFYKIDLFSNNFSDEFRNAWFLVCDVIKTWCQWRKTYKRLNVRALGHCVSLVSWYK